MARPLAIASPTKSSAQAAEGRSSRLDLRGRGSYASEQHEQYEEAVE